MNTNSKKKGRIAIAWLIIITMVFATMSTPFAMAKPVGPEPVPTTPNVTIYGFGQYTPGGTSTTLPADTDFIFFKQGSAQTDNDNQQMYIWTKTEIASSLKADIFAYVKFHDPSINKVEFVIGDVEFVYGYGDPLGDSPYSVTQSDNGLVVKWLSGKLSHLNYGQYDQEFKITVTKLVTLNESGTLDAIKGINGTIYVSLYSDSGFVNKIATKPITVVNGVAAPITFKVNNVGKYYVRESLDAMGTPLPSPTTMFGGYRLLSIEINPEAGIEVTTTSTNQVTITNNLSFNPNGSAVVAATKELTGTDRLPANGEFKFSLVQMTDNKFSIAMNNGHSQTASNIAGGGIEFKSIGYETADTYYYVMKEIIPADTVNGYKDGITYDDNEIWVTIEVVKVGEGTAATLKTAVSYRDADGKALEDPTFTNLQQYGQISVTKEVAWTEDSVNKTPINKTFRAGLFVMVDDEFELVQIEEEDAIVELAVLKENPSQSAKATFDNLPLYQTYYVFEIDENDLPIVTDGQGNFPGVTYGWVALKYTSNPIELIPTDKTGEITITNYFNDFEKAYDAGEITVTKVVTVVSGNSKVTHVFHVALFEDQEGKMVRVTGVEDLSIIESVSTSFTFKDLDLDKTYYVFETDKAGNIIQTKEGKIVTPILKDWTKIVYTNPMITLTLKNQADRATINNIFEPTDKFFDPSIKVIKTVTLSNKPYASNLTFYAGLFEDKELTKLVAFKPLAMKGGTTADASFAFYQDGVTPLKVGTTYYVAETNDQGKPLAGKAKELGFEITINGVTNNNAAVVLISEEAIVNIVNNFKKEEFPLTGDNSNMSLWLFLAMLGVAGALAPFAFRKKEKAND